MKLTTIKEFFKITGLVDYYFKIVFLYSIKNVILGIKVNVVKNENFITFYLE